MPTLDQLIGHAAMMTDFEFAADFEDCLLPVVDPQDRAKLEAYGRLRRTSRSFDPKTFTRHLDGVEYSHNNHQAVIVAFNTWLGDYGSDERHSCEVCAKPLETSKRSDAKTCSTKCSSKRKRMLARRQNGDAAPQVRAA